MSRVFVLVYALRGRASICGFLVRAQHDRPNHGNEPDGTQEARPNPVRAGRLIN